METPVSASQSNPIQSNYNVELLTMQQNFQKVQQFKKAYIDSHGTKTVQMPSLRKRVQSSWELEEAPDGTYWESAAQVSAVRQSFQL